MPDYKNMSKGIINALKGYADIQAQESKLKMAILTNAIEKKSNLIFKMQEQDAENQRTMELAEKLKTQFGQSVGGEDNLNIDAPQVQVGEGGKAKINYPSGADKQFKIKEIWGNIETKQNNQVPLNNIEKKFMEKYPKEIWIRQSGAGGVSVAQQKFDLAQEEKKQQQETKSQFVKDSALDTLNTIAEVEKGINEFGIFGNVPSVPGTERANWEANVNKLLSGKVIDVMTKMKEASKTGATGFGQLSEKELKVLQEASTALKRGLSPKNAQKYLTEMKTKLQKIAQAEEKGQSQTQGDSQRVKVKSPNGQIGSIPIGQLGEALSQGYQQVQ